MILHWITALTAFVEGNLTFRKRTAREKTLLQKSFPALDPLSENSHMAGGTTSADVGAHGCAPLPDGPRTGKRNNPSCTNMPPRRYDKRE